MYIHQRINWTHFTWDAGLLLPKLAALRHAQGVLLGKMGTLGFDLKQEAYLETLTVEVLKTSEIEGELLHPGQVRSSIARNLGLDIGGLIASDRYVDGVVEMMLDATQHCNMPLTAERLFGWHAALFPTGRSGMYPIVVGGWRKDETGPMQVVSGGWGRERVHFQAPEATRLDAEMEQFLDWFATENSIDPLLKAALAHIWFITIHPFDDGNGRIARAITELQLSRADHSGQRFYSMSAQIRLQRNDYYRILEQTQRGDSNITEWLLWFLNCLGLALEATDVILQKVLAKGYFWQKNAQTILNERQIWMLNKLLDDFEGKLNNAKWAKMAKCSSDTALRDLQDLVAKGILAKEEAGRSSNYRLV